MRSALFLCAASLLGTLASGCDKKETQRDDETAKTDAGSSKGSKAARDEPDLADALGRVAADRPPGASATAPGGPPANGIFAPGEADKAAPKGSPASLTLGSDGAEPRVVLGPAAKPGTKRSGSVDLATQSDPQQGAIPIQFAITLEAQKPKTETDAGTSFTQVLAKVTGAKINAPGVPADLSAAVGKLKGSRVEYQLAADGAASNAHMEVAKGVDPGFRDPVQALSDLLLSVSLPFPSKPVGVGAYWMVTSRDVLLGLDVVSYRLVKVESIEAGAVNLSLNVKRYAASPAFNLEGLPPEAPKQMSDFHAQSEGKLAFTPGEPFPKSGEIQSMIGAALGPADAKQRPMVQVQSRATFELGAP